MKNIIVLVTLILLCMTSGAGAGNSSLGAVTGAAGGALIGQGIGRNTEGTLIGAAVGGILGYVVGSEMDRGGYVSNRYYGGSRDWRPVEVIVAPPPPRPVQVIVAPAYGYYYPVPAVWRRGYDDHQGDHHWRHEHRHGRGHHRH
ncbi:MAG: glycine zipper 2TM domain-containing protein [Deltaproteobacteria bacterium]|nr:glycine zipper 2TM domain-containing protein [Deltaproteobacteria bacterium]